MKCRVPNAERRTLCALCLTLGVSCLAARVSADEALPRNPFWPQDYESMRYPITLEPRIKPEPMPERKSPVVTTNAVLLARQAASAAKAEAEKKRRADPLENPVWEKAVKVLRFGSTMNYCENGRSQAAIAINDRTYAVGDLLSANFEDCRFTWRLESLSTDGKIKLKRITYRKIGTNP